MHLLTIDTGLLLATLHPRLSICQLHTFNRVVIQALARSETRLSSRSLRYVKQRTDGRSESPITQARA
jgi:hypothetical protein